MALIIRQLNIVNVYSNDEVERWRNSLNHIISHVLRDERDVYVHAKQMLAITGVTMLVVYVELIWVCG